MSDFEKVLEQFRDQAISKHDKGFKFERLMRAYLLTDPKYVSTLKDVWLWSEFPSKFDMGGKDTGIDLVALTHTGEYWAIQCKCFQKNASINKASVDSFLATSSKEFPDVHNGKSTRFAQRIWISTTYHWGPTAEDTICNQNPPVTRINLPELEQAGVDWEKLAKGLSGEKARAKLKTVRLHQKDAIDRVHEYYKECDRGKLIMACGTGKTFTSLRIAERETDGAGFVLFLVPSIYLINQALTAWSADAKEGIKPICVCSDPKVSKKKVKDDDTGLYNVVDLAIPATTDPDRIVREVCAFRQDGAKGLTVVFSTYQSIDAVAEAQKQLRKKIGEQGVFDLIVCDEAHRTTGVTLKDDDESDFTKIHDNAFILGRKRMYMTATPRLFSDESKSRAQEAEAVLCSMDDPNLYGEEMYRIGFGEAVERDLLADYKVLILTMNDDSITPSVQKMIANKGEEITADDASKLIGCINALSKQIIGDNGTLRGSDPAPMRRAVAFCQTIKASQYITNCFNALQKTYLNDLSARMQAQMAFPVSRHIDGTMASTERDEHLKWLAESDTNERECRILTNARCLSEGVDVPSLDAVMFLSARNSQVDVVQSVGRVMRKAPGKKYGYIIIPVIIPSNVPADKALDNNDRYKVVWTVLNALRAHDDRFNAIINKIDLNKDKSGGGKIIIGVGGADVHGDSSGAASKGEEKEKLERQLTLAFREMQGVFYARMVQKVGDKKYWEQWAKEVADIVDRQKERIVKLVSRSGTAKATFDEFLDGLQKNINPATSEAEAVEMLSQHTITKPVFDALFEGYSFVEHNPISRSMQGMLDILEANAVEKDLEVLDKFYASVRKRAEGIDNAEGKQRIIIELYDKFFRMAFPKMVERLGIVYTPVEVVDFIVKSVDDVLRKEFNRSISDENIHILDPFTGTGTFVTRLLQSGLIRKNDLQRKFQQEIHANEIVLLAYYIAAVNIENVYHDLLDTDANYEAFPGICLTDTFQLGESDDAEKLFSKQFPNNSKRVIAQKKAPLRVIMGNPPYSIGQDSINDNAKNQRYPVLEQRIAYTYATSGAAAQKRALYDSYIKAFRWSSDRLDKSGGIICFVSNGGWLDGNAMDGFRKCLEHEFSSIYVFNLRGNQRTSGELSRKEGGKIFGSGSRAPIAITLLVKNPKNQGDKAKIYYHDIGDHLSREEKLATISRLSSVGTLGFPWRTLEPNEHGDWVNQRNDLFGSFLPLGDKKCVTNKETIFIPAYSSGLNTSRDAWCYNSSEQKVVENIKRSIDFYNSQVVMFELASELHPELYPENAIDLDPIKFSWAESQRASIRRFEQYRFSPGSLKKALYRPFFKQIVYFDSQLCERMSKLQEVFTSLTPENLVICISAPGGKKDFSVIITNVIPDFHLNGDTQCFPLYCYEGTMATRGRLFESNNKQYTRKDGVTDFVLLKAQKIYGKKVTKEDIFYYVYGILHSPDYRTTFSSDLKKMLPRLPLVDEAKDFWAFSKIGRDLASLHLNYESTPPYPGVTVTGEESVNYHVDKMRFPKKGQKDTIVYNGSITITGIPDKAYEYIVNGKSAVEWIMERYQITTHAESKITNDPNDWAKEVGNPRYILDLLLSVINISVQTVDLVASLPRLNFA